MRTVNFTLYTVYIDCRVHSCDYVFVCEPSHAGIPMVPSILESEKAEDIWSALMQRHPVELLSV